VGALAGLVGFEKVGAEEMPGVVDSNIGRLRTFDPDVIRLLLGNIGRKTVSIARAKDRFDDFPSIAPVLSLPSVES
jgi:hypothetical protein